MDSRIDFIKGNAKKNIKIIPIKEHNLVITEDAMSKINLLRKESPNKLIRITIDGGGCQGFQYKFTQDDYNNIAQTTKEVLLLDDDGKILIAFDLFSEFYIAGSVIDYENSLIKSGFKIKSNPKAKSNCGCQKSFASDEFYADNDEDN